MTTLVAGESQTVQARIGSTPDAAQRVWGSAGEAGVGDGARHPPLLRVHARHHRGGDDGARTLRVRFVSLTRGWKSVWFVDSFKKVE